MWRQVACTARATLLSVEKYQPAQPAQPPQPAQVADPAQPAEATDIQPPVLEKRVDAKFPEEARRDQIDEARVSVDLVVGVGARVREDGELVVAVGCLTQGRQHNATRGDPGQHEVGHTTRAQAKQALEQLQQGHAPLIGVVMLNL